MKQSRRQKVIDKHLRVRKKVVGSTEKPRLSIYKSNNHIYAQVIDDTQGKTIAAMSTRSSGLKEQFNHGGNCAASELVGNSIAKLAMDKGIKQVVFDRGGNLYHGRIKALAEAARASGLIF